MTLLFSYHNVSMDVKHTLLNREEQVSYWKFHWIRNNNISEVPYQSEDFNVFENTKTPYIRNDLVANVIEASNVMALSNSSLSQSYMKHIFMYNKVLMFKLRCT